MKNLGRFIAPLALATIIAVGGCNHSVNQSITLARGTKHENGYSTVNGSIHVENEVLVSQGKISTVNGGISVGENCTVQDVSTVNGGVSLGRESTAGALSTTNGGIVLGEGARAHSLKTTNGTVELASGAALAGDLTNVNGTITMDSGASVGGDTSSVNGRISLKSATVAGNVSNYNGGIQLEDGAVIEGSLTVQKPKKLDPDQDPPRIVIGRNCEVKGALTFERPVRLYVHTTAKVGPIAGAEAISYDGDQPPKE